MEETVATVVLGVFLGVGSDAELLERWLRQRFNLAALEH